MGIFSGFGNKMRFSRFSPKMGYSRDFCPKWKHFRNFRRKWGYFRDFHPKLDIFAKNGVFSPFGRKWHTFGQNGILSGFSPQIGHFWDFNRKWGIFELFAQNGVFSGFSHKKGFLRVFAPRRGYFLPKMGYNFSLIGLRCKVLSASFQKFCSPYTNLMGGKVMVTRWLMGGQTPSPPNLVACRGCKNFNFLEYTAGITWTTFSPWKSINVLLYLLYLPENELRTLSHNSY